MGVSKWSATYQIQVRNLPESFFSDQLPGDEDDKEAQEKDKKRWLPWKNINLELKGKSYKKRKNVMISRI